MGSIFVNYLEVAAGAPVEIPDLGVFPNQEVTEIEGDEDLVFPPEIVKSFSSTDSVLEEGDE